MERTKCYFREVKGCPEVQGGLSVFRLWQKYEQTGYCHLSYKKGEISMSEKATEIINTSIPVLSVTEPVIESVSLPSIQDNNVLLESIVNNIFMDDVEALEQSDSMAGSITENKDGLEVELQIDEDRMLSQSEINDYPVKMTQQQLLLLNSFSNRMTWLFNDISKLGIPVQTLQPHLTALQRMVAASRDIQCKIQSFVRKHRISDSSVSPISAMSIEMKEAAKEKTRLQSQIDILNDKLQFFSSEYQRITELYLQEKTRNSELIAQASQTPVVMDRSSSPVTSDMISHTISTNNSTTSPVLREKKEEQPTPDQVVLGGEGVGEKKVMPMENMFEQPMNEERTELIVQLEHYRQSIEKLMEERATAQKQLQKLKEEADDLQYALKVLLETGTIIPPELDERIQDAMDGTSLYDIDDDIV